MSYGMAWAGSAPGPVSPRSWLEGIYDYATKVMDPDKIFLGMPAYGWNWQIYDTPENLGETYRGVSNTYYAARYWMTGAYNFTGDAPPQPFLPIVAYWDDYDKVPYAFPHVYDYMEGADAVSREYPQLADTYNRRRYLTAYGKEQKTEFGTIFIDRDADGYWYGIYKGILGFMVNKDELARMNLEAPQDWQDLLKEEYKDLIWLSNYNTAGTAKLVINTMIQKYGHDEGIQYLVDLDKNIQVYTKSGSGPSKNVGTGECVVGIGFLHDGITQIVDNGYENIELVIPSSGTSFEVGATAIFKGAAHPNAAKLWIEYALSPECVELADDYGSYQFLVIDNAQQPSQAADFGLDPNNVMKYDFEDAKNNITTYIEEVMNALGGGDDRFQTE